ncbi:MAG: four-carbon acid sugar kinase family protein [Flavihumibacter sp.]|nr:four-carbon acid sugar kinase family protein [Flavihumibacter sp.]
MKDILLAYYGDDFTGSTDALEFITRAGAKAVLFTEPPTAAQLKAFPGLNAYGVAGKTRALPPDEIEQLLLPAFKQMKASGAKHVHYKVCSTFDSSPTIGSIGKAIDCGAAVFQNKIIPVLGGSPSLGRYCLYGNLFARMGIGSNGKIYRLDRHPSMSKHPVTPADESDLRLHLGKQTNKKMGLIDVLQLEKPVNEWKHTIATGEEVIVIDALYELQLQKIGEWLDDLSETAPQFSVGGSGIEAALGNYWNQKDLLKPTTAWQKIEKAKPLLVVSGSCSPVTAAQIEFAKANGFAEVVIDAVSVCNENIISVELSNKIKSLLQQQHNVLVHTGNKQTENLSSERLGTALGLIAKVATEQSSLKRVVIAGGDTSSYAARAMEIDAVEMIAPVVMGAPLCKAYSTNRSIDGLEVNFKGGQVGAENYFVLMQKGNDEL